MENYTKIIIFLSILILIFLILKLKDLLTPKKERFLKAAEDGDLKKIKSMLNKEINIKTLIKSVDKENNTALILASKFGYNEIVKILIENGADINAKDNEGTTALMNAAMDIDYYTNDEICKLLIENGADINAKDLQGNNALIYASIFEHFDIIKLLIESGAEINAKNNDGYTALMEASSNGNLETVKLLIENGADVNIKNNDGKTALDLADFEDEEIKEVLRKSVGK